eukprot:GILI01005300.1.p1 GENE.GILI01005300.1~~GILI01005300.1.p1  ORF type:complete len:182 (+),score=30.87 GILI01005300.1:131-676(+)
MLAGCEEDLLTSVNSLERKIPLFQSASGDDSRKLSNDIDVLFMQADDALRAIKIEIRTLAPAIKKEKQELVSQFEGRIEDLKRSFRAAKTGGSSYDASMSQSDRHRLRAAMATDRLQEGSERLKDVRRIAQETEDIGVTTIQELRDQRETIQRAHTKVKEIDAEQSAARKMITNMGKWFNW